MDEDVLKTLGMWIAGAVVLFVIMTMFGSCSVIQAGHRGVVYSSISGVQQKGMTEGFNWKVPWFQSVTKFDIRTQKLEVQADGASKDLQTVKIVVTLNYRLDPLKVSKLFQTVGRDYEQVVIIPAVNEAVKSSSAQFPVEQIIVERPRLRDLIVASLTDRLGRYDITLEQVSVTQIEFSPEFNKVVEEKQVEEQKIKTAEYKKKQAEQEKQTTILQAEGQAEQQRLMKSTITKDLVALKWIEKWDGKLPVTSMGNATPMVNIESAGGDQ